MQDKNQLPEIAEDDSIIAIRPITHADFDSEPTVQVDEELLKNLSVRDRKIFLKLLVIGRKLDVSVDNQVYHNDAIRNLAKRVARIEKWVNLIFSLRGAIAILTAWAAPYVLPKLIPVVLKWLSGP